MVREMGKNKSCPLGMKWILGIHFSYDDNRNNVFNFNHKVERLQTKLKMWSGRDLTLFGKVMIIKTSGLSQLIYSASNLVVPDGIAGTVKTKSFKFLWKNKKDKIKRAGLYQDPDKGRLGMTDINIMFKALRLAWMARLLAAGEKNWSTVPNHFFRKMGGLNFLLRCNYDTKYLKHLAIFYRNILEYFRDPKSLYGSNQAQDIILFNNKDILFSETPVYISEWF